MTLLEIILTSYLGSIFFYIVFVYHNVLESIRRNDFKSLEEAGSLWLGSLISILFAPFLLPIILISYIIDLFR